MPRGRPKKSGESAPPSLLTSTTRSSRRTAKQPALHYNVPDSDDFDELEESVSSPMNRSSFQGIHIPTETMSSLSRRQDVRISQSVSSLSTLGTPDSFSTSEYHTPDTSGVGTPVGMNALPNRSMNSTAEKGKKRKSRVAGVADDAVLARALQEEEYREDKTNSVGAPPDMHPNGRRRRASAIQSGGSGDMRDMHPNGRRRKPPTIAVLDDSDSEATGEQAIDNVSSSDEEPLAKKVKANNGLGSKPSHSKRSVKFSSRRQTAPLPARRARSSAQKAISKVVSVGDSDQSELSEVQSDVFEEADSDALEDEDSSGQDETSPFSFHARPYSGEARTFTERRRELMQHRRVNRADRERSKLEISHPEIKSMWNDLRAVPQIKSEPAKQPESITRTLKSFQLEGLNWLQKQEQTQWKGGLLGDEMGMGKTIQAVSLIMSDYPAKDPTLVVVPPVALMQWTNEINEYTDGKLKILVSHGTNAKSKNLSVNQLRAYDVIIISYNSLESTHRKEIKGWYRKSDDTIVKEASAIHALHFHRLILDEAHNIKARTSGCAKACFALKGSYKWCLSGTPVQNRIGEFFSLLRFLEVSPFANYFCKTCSCSSLHWSVDKQYRCTECGHRSLEHVSVFNQEILNPIVSLENDDLLRKEAFGKLRALTDRIMLRRMKRDHTASMELPPKDIVIHNEFFGEVEKDFANSIMGSTTRKFDTYVSRGVMLDNYANIFGLIMQMRQIADHPDLITKKHAEGGQNVLVCNICDEPAEDAIKSKCKHEFCRSCVKDYVRSCEASGASADCPRCHIALSIDFDQPEIEQDEDTYKSNSIINRIKMENWTSSTKIEMLVYELWSLRSKKQTTKSIVFSQFTSMLQLIDYRLHRAGFSTVMLDGSMTPAQRQKSIEYFMNTPDCEVFLVSLKAGGVALNLTEASRVFIIDPWWNPAAEWQSADRCHRIGQRRPCVITRLCVEDSIESRIVMLQEKKAQMIQGTVNGDDVAMEKLTPQDMQFLFRGS